MSGFSGLYIGLSALQSQQIVQETVAQNIANVNTEGYSRRVARLAPIASPPVAQGIQTGMGVEITDVRRSASLMLNQQIQEEKGVQAYWDATAKGMVRVEGLFQEPGDNGIAALMNEFWSSWQDLSLDPSSTGARTNVQQRAQLLADTLRRTHSGILDFTTGLDVDLRVQVDRVNVLATEIAGLNKQITKSLASGVTPNDLWDRRDMLLEELSTLSHAQTAENADGSTMVFLEGHMLVGSQGSIPLETQIDGNGNLQPMWSDDGTIAAVSSGEMGATRGLRDWALNEIMPKINDIATELIDAVNALHNSGFTLDNNPGGDFFSGTDAHDINLSALVASDLNAIVTAAGPDTPGDGSIALQMADLQDQERPALGDSIIGAYATMSALLGLNVQQSETMAGNQEALVGFLAGQRDSLAGVSLDEEGVTMIGAQRAYEAAARVITVVDEMLDQLINRTGMVGR